MDRESKKRRVEHIVGPEKVGVVLGYFKAGSLDELKDDQLDFVIARNVSRKRLDSEELLLSLVDPPKVNAMLEYYKVSDVWGMTDGQLEDAISRKKPVTRSFSEMFPGYPPLMNPIGPVRDEAGHVVDENIRRMYRFVRFADWEHKKAIDSGWDPAYINANAPQVFYPFELVGILARNEGGILDRWGLDDETKRKLSKWSFVGNQQKYCEKYSGSLGKTLYFAFKGQTWTKPAPNEFAPDFRTPDEKTMDGFVDINRERLLAMKEHRDLPGFPDSLRSRLCDPEFMAKAGVTDENREKILSAAKNNSSKLEFAIAMGYKDAPFTKERIAAKVANAIPRRFVTPESSLWDIYREVKAENAEQVMFNKGKRAVRPEFSSYLVKTCIDERFLNGLGYDLGKAEGLDLDELKHRPAEDPERLLAELVNWRNRIVRMESKGPLDEAIAGMNEQSKRSLGFLFTKVITPKLARKVRTERLEKLGVDMEALVRYYRAGSLDELTNKQLDEAYEMKRAALSGNKSS